MENQEKQILKRLEELEFKIDKVFITTERMRKYFLWTLIATIAVIIVPLMFLPFAISSLVSSLDTAINIIQ